jgi:hypothetical protein
MLSVIPEWCQGGSEEMGRVSLAGRLGGLGGAAANDNNNGANNQCGPTRDRPMRRSMLVGYAVCSMHSGVTNSEVKHVHFRLLRIQYTASRPGNRRWQSSRLFGRGSCSQLRRH